jgi:hypothetical protein
MHFLFIQDGVLIRYEIWSPNILIFPVTVTRKQSLIISSGLKLTVSPAAIMRSISV